MGKEIANREEWASWDPQQRLTHLLGLTLDECLTILEAPMNSRDAVLMHMKESTIRAILHTCMKLGIQGRKDQVEREKLLRAMTEKLK